MKFSTLLLLLSTLLPLSVQDEPREIEVRTLAFNYSAKMKNLSLAGDPRGDSQIEVELLKYTNSTQQPLTLVGDELLVGEPSAEGFASWESVSIDKALQEVLLVFFPVEDPKKPYHIVAVDDSEKSFPLGSFLLANMSPHALRFVIGDSRYEVKKGEFQLISELKNVKSNEQVPYYAYVQKDNDWKRLSTGGPYCLESAIFR